MTGMVEKVARALCAKVDGNNPDKVHQTRNGVEMRSWEFYREDAIVAIDAMMEPTSGMLAAGEDEDTFMANGVLVERSDAAHHYVAMIQAALKEEGQ